MRRFAALPRAAAWRHVDARDGFETVFVDRLPSGIRLRGATAALEDGVAWSIRYAIELDEQWITRRADVWADLADGQRHLALDAAERGRWTVDGVARPDLDGLVDVDIASSACTNTIPIHRLCLAVGDEADAPAVYVSVPELSVDRLEQHYARVGDDGSHQRFDYRSPRFGYDAQLVFDDAGLVLEYPGIATRADAGPPPR